uniref:Methyl-CpG binding domain protein 1b n=1 Tax=Oryzias latipes TaxID=8090 RepID=A0A3P9LBX7_ORYLA
MNEESAQNQVPASEPVEKDEGETTTENISKPEAENPSVEVPAVTDATEQNLSSSPVFVGETGTKVEEENKTVETEPPVDWFEPLEDDDAHSFGGNDPEEESLAGESERSESVAGSEKIRKKMFQLQAPRRRRTHPDEGWVEWPALGEGWKRKEVVRRSGSSIGQKDVYYMSPRGDRVRSRVELASVLPIDLTHFEFKTGKFFEGEGQPIRIRNRVKKKPRERSSSESSWLDREGADTPDSFHRLTPSTMPKQQNSFLLNSSTGILKQSSRTDFGRTEDKIRLPFPTSSRPLPSIKGEFGSEDSILVCAKCGISFTGTWYDKQRKRPCCPTCWASKTKEHPMIRFRKWIPCGQCVGCHNTINCGQCANCKHGLQSPESRKRICRKRRCICPIRKSPARRNVQQPYITASDMCDDSSSFQHPSLKSSDTENLSMNVDIDDDDMSTDDDEDWHRKRKRRSCGECKACLCRKDCGTCDFCIDKPKFGGSNKKRQKCRLRQCQRQAMRHLLPYQMGIGEYGSDGPLLAGRSRPHYTYSRKSNFNSYKGSQSGFDLTDNEDEDNNLQPKSWTVEPGKGPRHSFDMNIRNPQLSMQINFSDLGLQNGLPDRVPHISNHNYAQTLPQTRLDTEMSLPRKGQFEDEDDEEEEEEEDEEEEDDDDEEEELPMITQIFSLAENSGGSGADSENQLVKLLHSLRSSVLPILWYAIIVEGPQLQLIQCSRQSNMADTVVVIDPGFCYQVTVQKQPLLPTHPLYDSFPARMTSVTEVVSLLLGLEKYTVCHGIPSREALPHNGPVILERASTCDFLVKKNEDVCENCRFLCRFSTQ